MKKTALLILFFLAALTPVFSQYIPNGDMEDWTTIATYDSLDHWTSTNLFFAPTVTVTKTMDAASGTYAARMNGTTYLGIFQVPGGIGTGAKVNILTLSVTGGYPFTQRPDAFTGMYKYAPSNGDSCIIMALLTKWNGSGRDTIGIAPLISDAALTAYTPFNIPFIYLSTDYPDSAFVLALTSYNLLGAQAASVLFVDDLDFTIGTGVGDQPQQSEIVTAYPNPAKDFFTIDLKSVHKAASIQVFDLLGNKVKEMKIESNTVKINTSNFENGLYFYRLNDENSNALTSGKFSVKH
jgi:hypothetical protein